MEITGVSVILSLPALILSLFLLSGKTYFLTDLFIIFMQLNTIQASSERVIKDRVKLKRKLKNCLKSLDSLPSSTYT